MTQDFQMLWVRWCSRCGKMSLARPTMSEAQEQARSDGWVLINEEMAFCAECIEQIECDHSAIQKEKNSLAAPISQASTMLREHEQDRKMSALGAVKTLLEYMGEDPTRPELQDTPRRYVAFLDELKCNSCAEINHTTFEEFYDDLMVIRNVPLYSLCAHHLLPYTGRAHVGYIPKNRLLGLSKVARIVKQQASGLTTQEGLTRRIAEAVRHETDRPDVAVVTEAIHTCMVMRGACAVGSETKVSAMLGKFRDESDLRREFLTLLGG